MDNCNKCNKEKNHCGCTKIDAKCVLYKGECLENLDFCSPKDLEEIIKIIDAVIGEIYLSIDKFFIGLNVGLGAEVYKGKSVLGFEEFKTLTSNVSINITESENTLNFSIDEEWLTDFITNIIIGYTTNIESQNASLIIDDVSNPKNIELNPDVFTSANDSINITSSTPGGELQINFNVDEDFIIDIITPLLPTVPTIANVGSGADIYKGLNGTVQEFRGVTTNVTQPTNPGQLTGNITASTVVNGDNVQINLDFSDLSSTPQTFGVPEYYVNSANPEDGDGSIVNPYQTWELCKTAIGGTPDTSRNIKVIFQSNVTSNTDLTLNGVEYVFENSALFTYTGTGAIIDYGLFTGSTSKGIILSGNGSLQQIEHVSNTLNVINIIGGNGTFSRLLTIKGDITIIERNRNSNPSTNPGLFTAVDRLNEAGQIIYGYNEVFSKGTVFMTGENEPGVPLLAIEVGARLLIRDRINTTVQLSNVNAGSSFMTVLGTLQLLHIGNYYRYSTIGGTSPNTYLTYSTDIPRVLIQTGHSISFDDAVFKANSTGSSNSGGYSSLVKLTGNSSLRVTNNSNMNVALDLYYRYMFEVETDSNIQIDNINTKTPGFSSTNDLLSYIYASTSSNPNINVEFGSVDWTGSGTFTDANIANTPNTKWLFINGTPVSATMKTTATVGLANDIYTNTGVLTRD